LYKRQLLQSTLQNLAGAMRVQIGASRGTFQGFDQQRSHLYPLKNKQRRLPEKALIMISISTTFRANRKEPFREAE
jgi:hypothetical protein